MMAVPRWNNWRTDSTEQQIWSIARDLDDNDIRHDQHGDAHKEAAKDAREWQKHVDEEIEGLKKILFGFIVSAAGIIIVAAINVAVLIVQGK